MLSMVLAGMAERDGVEVVDDPGAALVAVVTVAVIVGLFILIHRKRTRVERDLGVDRRRRRTRDIGRDEGPPSSPR
jgi:hypothetical protein